MNECCGSDLGTQVHISPARVILRAAFNPGEASRHAAMKPAWGLWTSTLRDDGETGWTEWCRSESFCDPDTMYWHILMPAPDARILVIDSLADYIATVRRFPRRLDWHPTACEIDWAAIIATGYDAMWLTEHGAATCRLPGAVPDDVSLIALYSWDCESTVFLRWAFAEDESTVIRVPIAAPAVVSPAQHSPDIARPDPLTRLSVSDKMYT